MPTPQQELFWQYNATDCITTLDAWFKIKLELETSGNLPTYQKQVSLIEPLSVMQHKGLRVDVKGLAAASQKAYLELQSLTNQLQTLIGYEINPSSPTQLKRLFYETLKMKLRTSRTSKNATTDEKALKIWARNGCEEARILLKIRKLEKMNSSYYQAAYDPDGQIRCSFNPCGTESGRLSSGKTIFGTGINLQTLNSAMKKYLWCSPGHIAYELDLKGADAVVLAYVSGEPTMIEIFEQGIDYHTKTASGLFNKHMLMVSDDDDCKADPSRCAPIGQGDKSDRFWGKRSNHSLAYAMGPFLLAETLEIPNRDGKVLHQGWHKLYPSISNRYYPWVEQQLRTNRTLTNCLGRKRKFLGQWNDSLFKQAYSYIPQSTVADKINQHALIPLYYQQDLFKEVTLLNTVHDSVLFEIPLSVPAHRHAEILLAVKLVLETPLEWQGKPFTIKADSKYGQCLGQLHPLNLNLTLDDLTSTLEPILKELA